MDLTDEFQTTIEYQLKFNDIQIEVFKQNSNQKPAIWQLFANPMVLARMPDICVKDMKNIRYASMCIIN